MRTSALVVLAIAIGCGGGAKKPEPAPVKPDPVEPVTTADPVVADPPPVKPDEPPVDPAVARRQRAEAALTRIPEVKTKLAALRALPFLEEVPAEYQDQGAFETFVKAEVAKEFAPEKSKAIGTAMHHIGLLATEIDLAEMLGTAMVTQAAAYYDPEQKKFFVVMAPGGDQELDMISAHELTHALQDQHFNLKKYMGPKKPLDEDAANARKFVVEGEATLTMFAYLSNNPLSKDSLPALKTMLSVASRLSLDDLKAMTKAGKAGVAGIDPDMQRSLDAMDLIPPVILVPMFDSYMKGAVGVLTVFEGGGWDAVAKLYKQPPDSTEQMLHPDTKLYPTRDVPKKITLPKWKGMTEVYGNTIGGAFEWRVYFMLWKKAVAESAAAGWDGDRFSVQKTKDGTLVGLVVTTWDSDAEATEFATELEATVAVRFPNKERQVWIKTKGATVYVVDGGTDATLIDKLVKGTKVK